MGLTDRVKSKLARASDRLDELERKKTNGDEGAEAQEDSGAGDAEGSGQAAEAADSGAESQGGGGSQAHES